MPEPPLTDDIAAAGLDAEVRRDLRGLQKETAESVARHLVAAGTLLDEDPELALQHARYARRRASRIAVVREAAGIAAYHAGEWSEALGELRAARRMGGGPGHIAVMADIERALGRPERALELARGSEAAELGPAEQIELAIVAAGARRDLGELDAAVVGLQIPALDPRRRDPWSARLFYAYADNLLAAGRESDALQWFVHAADADTDAETDAAVRIAELTGEPLPEEDVVFGEEEVPEEPAPATDEATTVPADAGSMASTDDNGADDDAEDTAGGDTTVGSDTAGADDGGDNVDSALGGAADNAEADQAVDADAAADAGKGGTQAAGADLEPTGAAGSGSPAAEPETEEGGTQPAGADAAASGAAAPGTPVATSETDGAARTGDDTRSGTDGGGS